ncbi:MAG: hypothetical protein SH856_04455 [Flavobacteriales bacterium]|nr:hypothetical protein [Flavobacteriales bacterium]
MIKPIILLCDFLLLSLAALFTEPVINIEHNVPATITQGKKSKIDLVIDKGVLDGFAKLDLFVPPGFTATAIETKGASFTFTENMAKFIWMALPLEESFTISYYLETAQASGNYSINGQFSFIDDNVRRDYSIETKDFNVKVESVSVSDETTPTMAETVVAMMCSRSVTQLSSTEFKVDIKITDSEIAGFGKILETVPANCKIEKINDGGSVVTIDKNIIKFVWFDIPQLPEINVSYKISCVSAPDGQPAISGKLSYIRNNTPMDIEVTNLGMTTDPMSNNNTTKSNTTETEEDTTEADVVYDQPKKEPVVEPKTETKTEPKPKPSPKVTSVPDPETGVNYKVQILAAHRVVGKTYFASAHKYTGKFDIENHDGWVKYTTGKFSEYRTARDERERLKNENATLPGPFVTAYSNGERITVQEALLISKQQWYQ